MVVVLGTVGQAIPFKEGTGANLLLAVIANEVLWVPGLPQSMDHLGIPQSLAWQCSRMHL